MTRIEGGITECFNVEVIIIVALERSVNLFGITVGLLSKCTIVRSGLTCKTVASSVDKVAGGSVEGIIVTLL